MGEIHAKKLPSFASPSARVVRRHNTVRCGAARCARAQHRKARCDTANTARTVIMLIRIITLHPF